MESWEEISKLCEGISFRIPKIGAPPMLSGWNDALLRKLREAVQFDRSAYDRVNLKRILSRFYDFYFSGAIRKDDYLHAIVYDIIAISETKNGRIFTEPPDSALPFYPQNRSTGEKVFAGALNDFKTYPDLVASVTPRDRHAFQGMTNKYSHNSSTLFGTLVSARIDLIDIGKAPTFEERELIRLTGFLALMLLRFATKNFPQMANAFSKNQLKISLSTATGWPTDNALSPPCERCLDLCSISLSKSDKLTADIFKILVHEYVVTYTPNYEDSSVTGYLLASVLTHTSYNGIGMIRMLNQCCSITGKDWVSLKDASSLTHTINAWDKIQDFMETQLQEPNVQRSCEWARIINHGYFQGLSPKENVYLASVFAGIIEKVEGEGIWQAEWVKSRAAYRLDARYLGYAIYDSCLNTEIRPAAKSSHHVPHRRHMVRDGGRDGKQ